MEKEHTLLAILIIVIIPLGFIGFKFQTKPDQKDSFLSGEKWLDNNGAIINAHGGGILKYNDIYYWFGEHKIEGSIGNTAQVGVHCYSSEDLYNWKDEGIALAVVENDTTSPIAKGCILERPKVIYNKKYNQFVMWFHLELKGSSYGSALSGVAISKMVTGPYRFIKALRPNSNTWPVNYPESLNQKSFELSTVNWWSEEWYKMVNEGAFLHRDFAGGQMSRDMTIFVDDDGKAYHIHSAEENLTLNISELTDDYLDFSGRYAWIFPAGHNEAPAMFKYQNKYYLITSGCTGWKPNAARIAVADSIFGYWSYLGNPAKGEDSSITFNSQSTYILTLGEGKYIFMADRWNPENPIDGRYVWLPINLDEGTYPRIKWNNKWDLSVFSN
jgi:hypothetical protein